MIWGHGWSGYGPYRTARISTGARTPWGAPVSADVVGRPVESADVVRREGPVEGGKDLSITPGCAWRILRSDDQTGAPAVASSHRTGSRHRNGEMPRECRVSPSAGSPRAETAKNRCGTR